MLAIKVQLIRIFDLQTYSKFISMLQAS